MNIANKITIARIILIPIFMIVMLDPFAWGSFTIQTIELPIAHMVGTLIFIVAALTDWVDGYIARKYKLITTFGKFLDPLADKLLVSAALIILVDLKLAASWIVILIISREFAVTGLRLVLAGGGEVVAANMLGKIKTWAQMVAIIVLLLHNYPFEIFHLPLGTISLWIALIFTMWSGWDYFWKNRKALLASK